MSKIAAVDTGVTVAIETQRFREIPYIVEPWEITRSQKLYLPFKRFFDIVLSIIALIILSPLFLITAIAIKIDSSGPVFYHHRRIGKYGREFVLHKFRSMKNHPDNWLELLSPEEREEFKRDFKLKNDPRVTKLGNILRITSLDELPQLINIIRGDISIVGPRPIVTDELEKYGDLQYMLLSIKPGLTGYWQVSGRNDTSYNQRVDMDMSYIRAFSPIWDLVLIIKTFGAVIRKTGL